MQLASLGRVAAAYIESLHQAIDGTVESLDMIYERFPKEGVNAIKGYFIGTEALLRRLKRK